MALERLRKDHPLGGTVVTDVGGGVHARTKISDSVVGVQGTAVFAGVPYKEDEEKVSDQFALIQRLEHLYNFEGNVRAKELAESLRRQVQGVPTALVDGRGSDVQLVGSTLQAPKENILVASSRASGRGDGERFGVQTRDSGTAYVEPSSPHFCSVVHEAALSHARKDSRSWRVTKKPNGVEVREYDGYMPEGVVADHQNEIHDAFHAVQDEAVAHLQDQINTAARKPTISRAIGQIVSNVRRLAERDREEVDEMISKATRVRETRDGTRRYKEITLVLPDEDFVRRDEGALRTLHEAQEDGFRPDAITVTVTKNGPFGLW